MNDKDVQSLLENEASRLGIAGAQFAFFSGGRLREFAAGFRNCELELPVTVDTLFQIGSTTKLFNAALAMSLVDEGKLDLDRPLCRELPELLLADFAAQNAITLRQLLSMTAGIDNGSYHDYGRGDEALKCYVEAFAGVPQVFSPGKGFGYSNAGSCIAGYACSRVAGASWERLLTERILAPLSLSHAAMFAEDLLAHPVALGYARHPEKNFVRLPGWALPRSMAPAGGTLCASAGDLVRFARMFLDEGKAVDGGRVLSDRAVSAMHAPQVRLPTELMAQDWCIGPYRKDWGGCAIFGHSGTNLGGSSTLLWCPEKQVAAAVTVNVANQGYPLTDRLFDVIFPELFGIAKQKTASAETAAAVNVDLELFAGRYEALGTVLICTPGPGVLHATMNSDLHSRLGADPVLKTDLIPLGGNRFLPNSAAFSANRIWDVAFWDETGGGRPTHVLNGVFAYRRTG